MATPRISAEQRTQLIGLWKEILGVTQVDLDRGFADLGGNSLAATRFVARLAQEVGVDIPVLRVFEYPTLRLLLRFLTEGAVAEASPTPSAAPAVRASGSSAPTVRAGHDVAIVGMACRFPGARNLEEFWANLLDGKDTITILTEEELAPEVPAELRRDPRYVKAAGLIDDPYGMDAEFFGVNPMEAKLTDPQQRILLETAWQALEHAGEAVGRTPARTAVYAGTEDNSYYHAEILPFPEAEKRAGRFAIMTGNEKDYVAMRIAHKLNLRGPAVSVHTACSTSLVAVIMACKSLRNGDCDLALAGGASVHFPAREGYYFQEGGVFSSDGHCRPFDAAAEGTNFTDGAGIVVLKRIEDAIRDRNTIFAVIKGGAINSDGGEKASFSAPSVAGQAACIRAALADADVDAGTLQYLEAHGTATPVGDPIELEGLRQAFAGRREPERLQYCGLGSVKSNIGHTTAAAGVASLIKTAMALRHGVIPGTVHFERPNPRLELETSPFYIVDSKLDWPPGNPARRAGISSFGIGGTNSHLIVEEAPAVAADPAPALVRPFEIWPVSAKTERQRDALVAGLVRERYWPRDVAYTLQEGRATFPVRGARVRLADPALDDLLVQPSQPALEDARPTFMFPGQGSQYIGMGAKLADAIPEFNVTFSRCCEILSAQMGLDFRAFITDAGNTEALENTRYTQPALFAIEASLGRMLLDFGIAPGCMLGHSVGEFVAAHLAGVFSLEDALKLIVARGRLMSDLPRGRMLSVRGPLDAVVAAAGEPIDVASINGPVHSVLAADDATVARVEARLTAAGFACRPLHTSHAFHSAMMDPVVAPFLEVVRSVSLHEPRIPIISTVTAAPMTAAEATDPQYWAHHLRATVRFSPALFKALEQGERVFLEVGPRTTLSSLAAQHFAKFPAGGSECVAVPMLGEEPSPAAELGGLGTALARLWCAGVPITWQRIWAGGTKVPLNSTYPFERRDFRFSEGRRPERQLVAPAPAAALGGNESTAVAAAAAAAAPSAASVAERLGSELATLFGDYSGLSVDRLTATFVELGFDSLVLMQIGVELGKRYGVSVSLRELMNAVNTVAKLAEDLAKRAEPSRLAHLQSVAATPATQPAPAAPVAAPAAAPVAAATPQLPPVPAGAGIAVGGAGDVARLVHAHVAAMRELLDLQLRQLGELTAAGAGGLPPATSAAPPAVTATVAGAGTRAAPRIVGGEMRRGGATVGEPLIRVRHADPPQAGAFRARAADGVEAWYRFDEKSRSYVTLDEVAS